MKLSPNAKRYSPEFKTHAVRLVLEEGQSITQVSRELGVTVQSVRSWKRQYIDDNLPEAAQSMESEILKLRRENSRLREERDILKKAVGIVSTK